MSAFIDSSFVIAFISERDRDHAEAVRLMQLARQGRFGSLHTSNHVYAETVNFAMKGGGRSVKEADTILTNSEMVSLHMVDKVDFEAARQEFLARLETAPDLSLVDWSILAQCRRYGVGTILSFDRGFDGFHPRNVAVGA